MSKRLDTTEIQKQLGRLQNWRLKANMIEKQFVFDSFVLAIDFVDRVAPLAETADHHPDITIQYKKVTMSLSTHSEGGLTQKDFDLAGKMDGLRPG